MLASEEGAKRRRQFRAHLPPTDASYRVCVYIHTLCMGFSTQVEAFTSAGFLHRKGLQYHWRNRDRKIDGSVNKNNNSSKNKNNNNGAEKEPTATKSAVVLGTTPAETAAQQAVAAAEEEGDDDGTSKKYADFDSYLGNFASKRRIKVPTQGCQPASRDSDNNTVAFY